MESLTSRAVFIGLIGVAILSAIFLPAATLNIMSIFGGFSIDLSLREANRALTSSNEYFAVAIGALGVLIVTLTAFSIEENDFEDSRWFFSIGTAMSLIYPWRLLSVIDEASAQANFENEGALLDASLGLGMIILMIGFILVTGAAWYLSFQKRGNNGQYVSAYGKGQATMKSSWPERRG